ncbi:MAG: beta-lactam-binding protein with PASTA domain [Myxococcota bacterium]|jgi:beta-lactam-binding protein with PASTA domain
MATVHRARDEELERDVAVKLLHPHLTSDRRVLDRFKREALAAASLTHAGVVAVHDWGVDDGTPYLVMELVEGRSLRHVLDLRGRLRPGEVLSLLTPAIGGLGAAHDAGIVHRDVTPSNLLLTADGVSKLGDFGLARSIAATTATFADTVVGSPHYLSPEATRGEPLDARSDVYSLGCVLFECLTGRTPFNGDSPVAIATQHGRDAVPAASSLVPGLPAAVNEVVRRATARDPADRFADAATLGLALSAAVAGGPVPVDLRDGSTTIVVLPEHATRAIGDLSATTHVKPGRSRRVPPRLRRLLVLGLILAVLGGGGYVGWDRLIAPPTAVPAVEGMTVADARALLEDAGFVVVVDDDRPFDIDVPEGAVVSRSGDESARRMSTITLVLSAGPRTGALLGVLGRTTANATTELESLGLDLVVTTTDAYDDTATIGTVLASTPAAGTTVAEGIEVMLTISAGPAPVDLPDLTGETEASATATLINLGLTVRIIERRYDELPQGSVIVSAPTSGSTVLRGAEVGLTISDGPQPIEVPDVEGRREADAVAALEALGFVVDVRYVQTLLPFSVGVVDAQDPAGGSIRPKGSTIRIFVWA